MKVVGFNGSPRKNGNTAILINHVFRELEKEGIETELVELSEKEIHGCVACYKCIQNKDKQCSRKNDPVNEYIEKMSQSQGIILGSPVYFTDLTPEMKALIDRAGFVGRANGMMYRNKIGAAVAAARRTGAIHTVNSMNHFFLAAEMVIAGRGIGIGKDKGDVEKDDEGIQLVKDLGRRMAWLINKLYG